MKSPASNPRTSAAICVGKPEASKEAMRSIAEMPCVSEDQKLLLPIPFGVRSGPPAKPNATGLKDDEVSGNLLVGEASRRRLEGRVQRLDGPVVGEAGHDGA